MIDMDWMMVRGNGWVPARMVERAGTQEPGPVPERVPVSGGWATVVDGRVVDVTPYADRWGDGH